MIRFIAFILSLTGASGATYYATKQQEPLPILAEVVICTPGVTVGYILIQPDGDVGSIDQMSKATVEAYSVLRDAGKIRSGVLRFQTSRVCPI